MIQRYRDTGIQGYRDTEIQGYRDTEMQVLKEYRDTEDNMYTMIQRYNTYFTNYIYI